MVVVVFMCVLFYYCDVGVELLVVLLIIEEWVNSFKVWCALVQQTNCVAVGNVLNPNY